MAAGGRDPFHNQPATATGGWGTGVWVVLGVYPRRRMLIEKVRWEATVQSGGKRPCSPVKSVKMNKGMMKTHLELPHSGQAVGTLGSLTWYMG